ncbi:MAG: hypothetical protein RIS29_1548 [Bacteroidota bacterium]
MKLRQFCILLLSCPCLLVLSQNNTQNVALLPPDTIRIDQDIPELDKFIQSAVDNSALLKASDQDINQIYERIKKNKLSLLDFITIDANTRYGLYNTVVVSSGADAGTDAGTKAAKQQLNYYAGLTLRVPISAFITNKNDIKILKYNAEQTKYKKEELKNALIISVVDEYYKLVKMNKSVKISQDALQTTNVNFIKAGKDIASGLITLADYNSVLASKAKVEEEYNTALNEYRAQYMRIQILTGLKLNRQK